MEQIAPILDKLLPKIAPAFQPSSDLDERWALYADKRTHSINKSFERKDMRVNCPYCLDKGMLFMDPRWVALRHIPLDAKIETHENSKAGGMRDQIAVPCDCKGQLGTEDGDKLSRTQVMGFERLFGQEIRLTAYGRRLKNYWLGQANEQVEEEAMPF